MLESVTPSLLKVLIIGANTGGLPWVEEEVASVHAMFSALFQQLGWPESDISVLTGNEATAPNIEFAIRTGGFHILHFAGHGIQEGNSPAIAVFNHVSKSEMAPISAVKLSQWIRDSDLRFVYLGSCESADPNSTGTGEAIRQFNNVLEAVVGAGTPEVLGFVWPIRDKESKDFAAQFYRHYLQGFDASVGRLRQGDPLKKTSGSGPRLL
jgi:CHAT domain-containing protein